jgi:hypothetical protein
MAFFGQSQPAAIADGAYTQTIYTLIRDHKFSEAIKILQYQLQASSLGACTRNPGRSGSWSPCR